MMYQISLCETKGRKIYVDPELCEGFYLYPGEVRRYKLEDGKQVTEEELTQIRKTCALPRAKKRAMGILVKQDKTEQELRQKLEQSMTDSISLEETMEYLRSFGYVNDYRYASDYIRNKKKRKSYRLIRSELKKKGIPEEVLEQVFAEAGEQKGEDIREQIEKYIRKYPEMNREARQKVCAHFYRKGYAGSLVMETLERILEDKED